MDSQLLMIERMDPSISKIVLNRPEKHNALSLELMDELCCALADLESSGCHVVILSAEGKDFCSGLDLQQASDEELIGKIGLQLAKLFTLLHNTSLVTIATVQGHAVAGGGGLAASCDIMLMAEGARIGFPETRRGLVAAQVSAILVRQLSIRHVRELLLLGEFVDCRRALEIGLANDVVRLDELQNEALRMAQKVLKGSPGAIKETKRLLEKLTPGNFSKDFELALSVHHAVRISSEAREGIASFLEKRPPEWEK